jgi:GR25 family glycosyltransferase involved in LPS biosynthesis
MEAISTPHRTNDQMKSFVIYLPTIESTVKASQTALSSAKKYGLDVELFAGYTPSQADDYIAKEKLKPYLPGPKLFSIKWKRGGVRGCMISHLNVWKKCVDINEPILVLEHDSEVVSNTFLQPFEDVLHLDAHRFIDPDPDQSIDPIVQKFDHYRKGEQQLKGTYGYVLKPHAAQKLIEGAYTDGLTASDMFVKDKYVTIQVVRPRAVRVTSQDSLTVDRSFNI